MERKTRQETNRLRHTDLKPLATDEGNTIHRVIGSRIARSSESGSPAIPNSAISLASPTMAAVRQYYHDHGLKTAFQSEGVCRRHSMISPGALASRLENVAVSSPVDGSGQVHSTEYRSMADKSRDILLNGVNRNDLGRLGSIVSRKTLPDRPVVELSMSARIPSEYSHARLREWGYIYLGNIATADAFVRALHLRRQESSTESTKDDFEKKDLENSCTSGEDATGSKLAKNKEDMITIRARILPRAKERKPFLLQRSFNLEQMRAISPQFKSEEKQVTKPLPTDQETTEIEAENGESSGEGSKSTPSPPPAKILSELSTKNVPERYASSATVAGISKERTTPLHVEYALHYLPILAALMLSGHIRKGDTIDLPLPHPRVWREVVSYVYTGEGKLTTAMKENIAYLGGHIT